MEISLAAIHWPGTDFHHARGQAKCHVLVYGMTAHPQVPGTSVQPGFLCFICVRPLIRLLWALGMCNEASKTPGLCLRNCKKRGKKSVMVDGGVQRALSPAGVLVLWDGGSRVCWE